MTILADVETRIMVQGITGREAATFTLESLRYGAWIVAGVTPGKAGQKVHGVPVFDTVAQALRAALDDGVAVLGRHLGPGAVCARCGLGGA